MTNYKAYGLNLSKDIKDAIIGAHNDKTEITIGLRVIVRENRAGSKDRGRPISSN